MVLSRSKFLLLILVIILTITCCVVLMLFSKHKNRLDLIEDALQSECNTDKVIYREYYYRYKENRIPWGLNRDDLTKIVLEKIILNNNNFIRVTHDLGSESTMEENWFVDYYFNEQDRLFKVIENMYYGINTRYFLRWFTEYEYPTLTKYILDFYSVNADYTLVWNNNNLRFNNIGYPDFSSYLYLNQPYVEENFDKLLLDDNLIITSFSLTNDISITHTMHKDNDSLVKEQVIFINTLLIK